MAAKLTPGDRAMAEALRIAEDWLKRQGWKFTPKDVGDRARDILDAVTGRATLEAGTMASDILEKLADFHNKTPFHDTRAIIRDAAAEIASLRQQLAASQAREAEAYERAAKAAAENLAMKEALTPFAAEWENVIGDPDDACLWEHPAALNWTASDVRRAHSVLALTPGPDMVETLVSAMRDDPFIDDACLRGTTQQDCRCEHYANIAIRALAGREDPSDA